METIAILTTTTCTETAYGLQCHFSSFLPSSQIWNSSSERQHITRHGKSPSSKHHCSTLLCLATHGKQSQWNLTSMPCDHTINTSSQGLSTPPKQLLTTDTFQYEAIRRYKYSMELVHPPRNICFNLGIAYTSGNRIILLLFLLVLTCQIIACRPLQSGNTQYTIVDDNVEVAPIYSCKGKANKPTRPCENHGLAIEHLPTWSESHHKLQSKSFAVPTHGSLGKSPKIQGTQECT